MTRVNRIASNKPELDMVLLCIVHTQPASLGWELSGFFWFRVIEFSLVRMSLVGCGSVRFVMDEFGLAWMEDNPKIFVHFEGRRPR